MIYLDYAANTPVEEEVLACFCQAARKFMGNANSQHSLGIAAKAEMERITISIAQLMDIKPEEIIYTSGATESNNLALKGLVAAQKKYGRHIISTPLEHSSVSSCLATLQQQGYVVDYVGLGIDGKVDLKALQTKLRPDTILVAVSAVDSELGTIQPVAEIATILQKFPQLRFHVDATQAMGKLEIPLAGIDTMSFAPHKFYGLCGSGVLYKRKGVELIPLIEGGSSTTRYRSGTPALALAAATEVALRLALLQRKDWLAAVAKKQAFLRSELSKYAKVRINSPLTGSPYILNLSVAGVRGENFQRLLNAKGVCVSVRSACSTAGKPSPAVLAVTGDYWNALSSWRISLSHLTTEAELEEFLRIFVACYQELTGTTK